MYMNMSSQQNGYWADVLFSCKGLVINHWSHYSMKLVHMIVYVYITFLRHDFAGSAGIFRSSIRICLNPQAALMNMIIEGSHVPQ